MSDISRTALVLLVWMSVAVSGTTLLRNFRSNEAESWSDVTSSSLRVTQKVQLKHHKAPEPFPPELLHEVESALTSPEMNNNQSRNEVESAINEFLQQPGVKQHDAPVVQRMQHHEAPEPLLIPVELRHEVESAPDPVLIPMMPGAGRQEEQPRVPPGLRIPEVPEVPSGLHAPEVPSGVRPALQHGAEPGSMQQMAHDTGQQPAPKTDHMVASHAVTSTSKSYLSLQALSGNSSALFLLGLAAVLLLACLFYNAVNSEEEPEPTESPGSPECFAATLGDHRSNVSPGSPVSQASLGFSRSQSSLPQTQGSLGFGAASQPQSTVASPFGMPSQPQSTIASPVDAGREFSFRSCESTDKVEIMTPLAKTMAPRVAGLLTELEKESNVAHKANTRANLLKIEASPSAGTWAKTYRMSDQSSQEALELLFRCNIIPMKEFADSYVSQEHIDECVWISTQMLRQKSLDEWVETWPAATRTFEESVTACFAARKDVITSLYGNSPPNSPTTSDRGVVDCRTPGMPSLPATPVPTAPRSITQLPPSAPNLRTYSRGSPPPPTMQDSSVHWHIQPSAQRSTESLPEESRVPFQSLQVGRVAQSSSLFAQSPNPPSPSDPVRNIMLSQESLRSQDSRGTPPPTVVARCRELMQETPPRASRSKSPELEPYS